MAESKWSVAAGARGTSKTPASVSREESVWTILCVANLRICSLQRNSLGCNSHKDPRSRNTWRICQSMLAGSNLLRGWSGMIEIIQLSPPLVGCVMRVLFVIFLIVRILVFCLRASSDLIYSLT